MEKTRLATDAVEPAICQLHEGKAVSLPRRVPYSGHTLRPISHRLDTPAHRM
jgi:hypothetical protein